MSRLYYHEKSDRRKWAAITIVVLLIIAAIVLGVLSNWYTDFNKYCLFGHDYGDDGKCVRCGKEKPIENEPEVEPQAFGSKPYRVYALASPLMASNEGIDLQSDDDGLETVEGWTINFSASSLTSANDVTVLSENTSLNSYLAIVGKRPTRKNITILNDSFLKLGCANWEDTSYQVYFTKVGSGVWQTFKNTTTQSYGKIRVASTTKITDAGQYLVCIANSSERSEIYTVNFNVQELPAAPIKTGYTFTGWYTDEACTTKYTESTITGDITLYAGFRANTYSIKFIANSGSGTMANEPMTYDQAKNLTANGFNKEHYAFKGWATSANGDVVYSNGQSVKNLTATDGAVIELFAVWERSEVLVTFVAEGTTSTKWIAIGTSVTLPETPTKEGHTFLGWFVGDNQYDGQAINEDTTLTAQFAVIRCTVTFIVDGEVYATYTCDWGTNLAEALNANDVNSALLKTEDEYSRNF